MLPTGLARQMMFCLSFALFGVYWVRYDKYEIRTDAKGTKYVTAAEGARPQIIDPLEDAQTMVLDALNAGRLFFGKKAPEREQEAGILRFVHRYGLLGLMTALPTTPKFMQYEKVYLTQIILLYL